MDHRNTPLDVQLVRLPHAAGLALPRYQTPDSAGMDLLAAIDGEWVLEPLERRAVPTGLTIALPAGYEAQVRPRSGLAFGQGVTVVNAPGTVDSDYRGEVKVGLINLGGEPFAIRRGDRIAQLVIAPVVRGRWVEVERLPESIRAEGGFGHTGR